MDYLDAQKEFRHRITLFVGYVLLAIVIVTSALILLNQAYGFGINRQGTVIQNGLTFFSSQPNPANIYVDGVLNSKRTNTRLFLPADIYQIKLSRPGYRDWQRSINLNGGSVEHFDYPLLFPSKLVTKKIGQTYSSAPSVVTQSPDHRWLAIGQPGSLTTFDIYDLKNPGKPPLLVTLPPTLLNKATGAESLQFVEWADDNQHLLLQHLYDDKSEFIILDRTDGSQSLNLNTTLAVNPTQLTLNNKKYDQFYLYDAGSTVLQTASIKNPTPVERLGHVLAYKSYSDDTVLYATTDDAPPGKVLIRLVVGTKPYSIKQLPAGTTYLVDLTKYDGTMYVVTGASSDNKAYIYRDPVGQLNSQPKQAVVPTQVLHVQQPNYLSFSSNAQFIVLENGQHFGVYDIENRLGYNYLATLPLDSPQVHAIWMDGNRLVYISNGKLTAADYDNTNRQSLMPAVSAYLPAFAPNYKFVYTMAPAATNGQYELTQTALLTPADQ